MPPLKCSSCGRKTNTSTSDAWDGYPLGQATKCYAAYVDGQWVEWCAYEEADDVMKFLVDRLIAGIDKEPKEE